MVIVNLTGSDLSKTVFGGGSGKIKLFDNASGSYRYEDGRGFVDIDYLLSVEILYKVVNSLDDVGKNDHVGMVVEDIPGSAIGYGELGGRVFAVEQSTIAKNLFSEVVWHELVHNLGVGHIEDSNQPNRIGLMNENVSGSLILYPDEIGIMSFKMGYSGLWTHEGPSLKSYTYKTHSRDDAFNFLNRNKITY